MTRNCFLKGYHEGPNYLDEDSTVDSDKDTLMMEVIAFVTAMVIVIQL